MTERIGMSVEPAHAWAWVGESLAQGTPLALLAAERLADASFSARLLVPCEAEPLCDVLDGFGRRISTRASDLVAADLLRVLNRSGATTLLVEDEFAKRGAKDIGTTISFIGDRIVHWTGLEDAAAGPLLMRRASAGCPTNALVCRGTPAELGLEHEHDLDEADLGRIVEAMRAVVVSVYDTEAFVALVLSAPLKNRP